MSGGSEADFDLGYKVNVDSHRVLLQEARKQTAKRSDGHKVIYGELLPFVLGHIMEAELRFFWYQYTLLDWPCTEETCASRRRLSTPL